MTEIFVFAAEVESVQKLQPNISDRSVTSTRDVGTVSFNTENNDPVLHDAGKTTEKHITCMLITKRLTVDLLDALQVVQRQLEVVRVHVLIERSHDGARIVGVLQTQRVTQLVDRHQEQVVTWRRDGRRERRRKNMRNKNR